MPRKSDNTSRFLSGLTNLNTQRGDEYQPKGSDRRSVNPSRSIADLSGSERGAFYLTAAKHNKELQEAQQRLQSAERSRTDSQWVSTFPRHMQGEVRESIHVWEKRGPIDGIQKTTQEHIDLESRRNEWWAEKLRKISGKKSNSQWIDGHPLHLRNKAIEIMENAKSWGLEKTMQKYQALTEEKEKWWAMHTSPNRYRTSEREQRVDVAQDSSANQSPPTERQARSSEMRQDTVANRITQGAIDLYTYLGLRPRFWSLGPDEASDVVLAKHYTFLLRSEHFQRLARIVNSEEKITLLAGLLDTSPLTAAYSDLTHTIGIPLSREDGTAKSSEEIRESIVWEMHNASMRDQIRCLREKLGVEKSDQNSSREEKEIYPYKRAAYALASEWKTWATLIEHAWLCQAINADPNMGEGGPHIREGYKYLTRTDDKWYSFRNYLQYQIKDKHTTYFDPKAADPSWVGEHVLAIVEQSYPNSLIITHREVQEWRDKKRGKVKSTSDNPFNSLALVKQARQRATW